MLIGSVILTVIATPPEPVSVLLWFSLAPLILSVRKAGVLWSGILIYTWALLYYLGALRWTVAEGGDISTYLWCSGLLAVPYGIAGLIRHFPRQRWRGIVGVIVQAALFTAVGSSVSVMASFIPMSGVIGNDSLLVWARFGGLPILAFGIWLVNGFWAEWIAKLHEERKHAKRHFAMAVMIALIMSVGGGFALDLFSKKIAQGREYHIGITFETDRQVRKEMFLWEPEFDLIIYAHAGDLDLDEIQLASGFGGQPVISLDMTKNEGEIGTIYWPEGQQLHPLLQGSAPSALNKIFRNSGAKSEKSSPALAKTPMVVLTPSDLTDPGRVRQILAEHGALIILWNTEPWALTADGLRYCVAQLAARCTENGISAIYMDSARRVFRVSRFGQVSSDLLNLGEGPERSEFFMKGVGKNRSLPGMLVVAGCWVIFVGAAVTARLKRE